MVDKCELPHFSCYGHMVIPVKQNVDFLNMFVSCNKIIQVICDLTDVMVLDIRRSIMSNLVLFRVRTI